MIERPKDERVHQKKRGSNLYSLQSIQPEKLIRLVEKVLREEYYLVR